MQQPLRRGALPERIGPYEILAAIASGGMARVYLSRARGPAGFERDVAVKVTHAHLRESSDFARLLIDEAKLAGAIHHPNVVPVLDVGDDPSGLYLVMEYVEGDTLGGLVRRGAAAGAPLPPPVGLRVLLDALAGLHAAHELKDDSGQLVGLVHRDFSPQNILVGTDGIGRLTDFGIAKAVSRLGQTRTGVVKGKIAYMAPEQARGKPVDRRCDVWAAGVIAWELLAGRRMHEGMDDELGLIFRIGTETPPRLRSVLAEIPAGLDDAVAKALTPDRSQRFATAVELARELARAAVTGGIPIADAAEVAEHVALNVGERLAARREQVARALARRGMLQEQVASIARDEPTDAVSREVSVQTVVTPAPDEGSAEVDAEPIAPVQDARAPGPVIEEATATDLDAAAARAPAPPPRIRPLVMVVGGGVLTAITVLVIVAASRARPEDPATVGSVPEPLPALVAQPIDPAPTPSAPPQQSVAVPAAESASAAVASASSPLPGPFGTAAHPSYVPRSAPQPTPLKPPAAAPPRKMPDLSKPF